ncbi:hypothetical protein [Mycobacterium sp. 852002-40037_SCH5390672]|uniref:hypothetical protein n=1 Tax=Mycobacterium sp. 852002-40037_SCH5390672 TaxID=1834089 RepID=UPI00080517B7|nr:hypothetical protein [Mycobacterium sp. 852002-40037_SCH5390672]OBC01372.1 hypothetical protein A5782_20195 [Mycobacterium sp. 852002-40037_SCH5390672]
MRQTITGERSNARYPIAETLWIIGGMVLLLALGDVVIVLALTLAAAAMTTVWCIRRDADHRARSSDVALASISHLATGSREMKKTHAPWHRHSAA